MNIRVSVVLLAAFPAIVAAQTALPPDIHPVTLSRLPPVTPADLDAEGQRLLAARQNFTPGPGPRTLRSATARANAVSAFPAARTAPSALVSSSLPC